jgi:uncharacterized membrane protein YphA (DoxX/SURF4 family)
MRSTKAAPAAPASSIPWPALALAARILLAVLYLVSGLHKTAAPAEEFAAVIDAYQIMPPDTLLPFAHFVPFVELLLAFSLLSGFLIRLSAAGTAALSLSFFVALSSTIVRGIPLENCGCFGSIHLTPPQAMSVDAFMMALAVLVFLHGRSRWSLDSWIESGETAGRPAKTSLGAHP